MEIKGVELQPIISFFEELGKERTPFGKINSDNSDAVKKVYDEFIKEKSSIEDRYLIKDENGFFALIDKKKKIIDGEAVSYDMIECSDRLAFNKELIELNMMKFEVELKKIDVDKNFFWSKAEKMFKISEWIETELTKQQIDTLKYLQII